MKQSIEKMTANRDVGGARVRLSGRLGGTDIARSEELKKGRIPLQTLRADIDFARERAHMTYGDIGIKGLDIQRRHFRRKAKPAATKA